MNDRIGPSVYLDIVPTRAIFLLSPALLIELDRKKASQTVAMNTVVEAN